MKIDEAYYREVQP